MIETWNGIQGFVCVTENYQLLDLSAHPLDNFLSCVSLEFMPHFWIFHRIWSLPFHFYNFIRHRYSRPLIRSNVQEITDWHELFSIYILNSIGTSFSIMEILSHLSHALAHILIDEVAILSITIDHLNSSWNRKTRENFFRKYYDGMLRFRNDSAKIAELNSQ